MGAPNQSRQPAGTPKGGQFGPSHSPEPEIIGLDPAGGYPDTDYLPEPGDGMAWDDIEGGVLWRYKGRLQCPEAVIHDLFIHGVISHRRRAGDPNETIRGLLRKAGRDPDAADRGEWDSDKFPIAVSVGDQNLESHETIVGPDGEETDLYRDPADIPPKLPGLDRLQRRMALANYRFWAAMDVKTSGTERSEAMRDPATRRFPDLSNNAKRALNREAAELWSTIPEELRTEITEPTGPRVNTDAVFQFMRVSATGSRDRTLVSQYLTITGLGQRIHDTLDGSAPQILAARRAFHVNDDGELDYR